MSSLQTFPTLPLNAQLGDVITLVNQLARIRQNDQAQWDNQNVSINKIVTGSTQSSLIGATTGSITYSMPVNTAAYKLIVAYASGYENDTTISQIITYPTQFTNTPVVTENGTTLTITSTTAALTISTPDSTATSTGLILVQGY
jgi:hypothetical protein